MRRLEGSTAINNVRCVQFRPKVSTDQYYTTIKNGPVCYSTVCSVRYHKCMLSLIFLFVLFKIGRVKNINEIHTIILNSSTCLYEGLIMHELLHAIGKWYLFVFYWTELIPIFDEKKEKIFKSNAIKLIIFYQPPL
jgi:hypothetical protein